MCLVYLMLTPATCNPVPHTSSCSHVAGAVGAAGTPVVVVAGPPVAGVVSLLGKVYQVAHYIFFYVSNRCLNLPPLA